jgi:hypothetical protein
MYSENHRELLDTIFKLFPDASIISKSDLKPIKQTKGITNGNLGLAKIAKPQGTVLRACKQKSFDSRQLSLFHEIKRGGI